MAPSVALGDVAIPRCVTLSSGVAPSLFHPLRLLLLSLSKSLLPLFLLSVSRLQLFVPGPLAHLLLFPDPCPFVSTFLFLFLFLCLFLSLSFFIYLSFFLFLSVSLIFCSSLRDFNYQQSVCAHAPTDAADRLACAVRRKAYAARLFEC